jgi:hypothetical protein
VTAARRSRSAVARALLALGAVVSAGGCAGKLSDLEGPRGTTEWITAGPGPADGVVEVPATFILRNRGLGAVRVESLRVPVSTEVSTDPALPASIGGGKSLTVAVIAKFRASEGDAIRTIRLESAGEAPVELMVDGRFKPAAPADDAAPQPIAAPQPAAAPQR